MIRIEFRGMRKVQNYLRRITKNMPFIMENSNRALAKDVQRGARYRLSLRYAMGMIKPTGALWRSIKAYSVEKGQKRTQWRVRAGDARAPYASIIERGISGFHFVPKLGAGWKGVGYARRGGRLPVTGGKHFMRDAMLSTDRRAPQIVLRELEKVMK